MVKWDFDISEVRDDAAWQVLCYKDVNGEVAELESNLGGVARAGALANTKAIQIKASWGTGRVIV